MSQYLGETHPNQSSPASAAGNKRPPKTLHSLMTLKAQGQKITMLTCYDAAFGRLLDTSDLDMVLVGDSLGNVIQGRDDTLGVTLQDMIYHCRMVAKAVRFPFVVCDLPFGSYRDVSFAQQAAVDCVQLGGAKAVKLEGGKEIIPQIKAIVALGIPVVGHLGLTPQSIHALSGYRVQGREDQDRARMIEDALALQEAGVSFLVLELIPQKLAQEITASLKIPTIGIGAGSGCDGQVLVLHDLLGFDSSFKPKFLRTYADLGSQIKAAVNSYHHDVKSGQFPTGLHSFD